MTGVVWPDESFDLLRRSEGDAGTDGFILDLHSVAGTTGSGDIDMDGVGPTSAQSC